MRKPVWISREVTLETADRSCAIEEQFMEDLRRRDAVMHEMVEDVRVSVLQSRIAMSGPGHR